MAQELGNAFVIPFDRCMLAKQNSGELTIESPEGVVAKLPSIDQANATYERDWILIGGVAGQSSAWLPFMPGMSIGFGLDSGSTSTIWSIDISFNGQTSVAQAWTDSWDRPAGTWLKSPPMYLAPTLLSQYIAAVNSGADVNLFFRFNVVSGGPLSVIRNI